MVEFTNYIWFFSKYLSVCTFLLLLSTFFFSWHGILPDKDLQNITENQMQRGCECSVSSFACQFCDGLRKISLITRAFLAHQMIIEQAYTNELSHWVILWNFSESISSSVWLPTVVWCQIALAPALSQRGQTVLMKPRFSSNVRFIQCERKSGPLELDSY